VIFWPRETATLLKSNLRYFHREKSTFEKFDAGLKLKIVSYTQKTIKNRKKIIRVIYTLRNILEKALRYETAVVLNISLILCHHDAGRVMRISFKYRVFE